MAAQGAARVDEGPQPQFVQLRLDDGVEAWPDTMDQARVFAGPTERIEVMIADATVRVPDRRRRRDAGAGVAAVRSTQ